MLTSAEKQQRQAMDAYYEYAQHPAMLKIERQVCGCDYGASSWTTRAEADRMAVLLELRSGSRLLDIGSGSGWPGLYLSRTSGCDLTLIDLPIFGLKIAQTRSMKETSNASVWLALADAAALPFAHDSFDAVCHADLLCCLLCKKAVLRACQNILRPGGSMVFSVISIPSGFVGTRSPPCVGCWPGICSIKEQLSIAAHANRVDGRGTTGRDRIVYPVDSRSTRYRTGQLP